MEKTTKELKLEKENYIKEMDQKIYESAQRDGVETRAREAKRRTKAQELEDKGWVGKTFTKEPVIIEPEIEIIIEPKEPETIPEGMPGNIIPLPEPVPEPDLVNTSEPLYPEVDTEKEALKAQLELAKEKLALLDAAKKMEEPEKVEILPEIKEEIIEESEE